MKTIEEKAKRFAKAYSSVESREDFNKIHPYEVDAFTAGANFILDKLRWRDPKEELPEKYHDVLVKIECEAAGVFYLIGYTVEDNTWRLYYGDGISIESEGRTIVGWREIIEP